MKNGARDETSSGGVNALLQDPEPLIPLPSLPGVFFLPFLIFNGLLVDF